MTYRNRILNPHVGLLCQPNQQLGTLFYFLCSCTVVLSVYWQSFQVKSTAVFFLLQRCCLCKAVRRHTNYSVQRTGIMMTALGSKSVCTVRKEALLGSYLQNGWQLLILSSPESPHKTVDLG